MLQIMHGLHMLTSLLKMCRQLSRTLRSLLPIPGLYTCTNAGVELDTPPAGETIVYRLSIQGMAEPVAFYRRSVRPFLGPT